VNDVLEGAVRQGEDYTQLYASALPQLVIVATVSGFSMYVWRWRVVWRVKLPRTPSLKSPTDGNSLGVMPRHVTTPRIGLQVESEVTTARPVADVAQLVRVHHGPYALHVASATSIEVTAMIEPVGSWTTAPG
jgi:hypothetical protein